MLWKERNSLLSKGMSNVYLKVTTEKKRRTRNFDFLSLKSLSSGHFLGSCNSHRYHSIFKLLVCNLKIRGLRAKLCVAFSVIFILKGIMTF